MAANRYCRFERLPLVRTLCGMLQARENLLCAFSRNDRAQFFHACSLNIRDAAKFFEQLLSSLWSDAGNLVECAVGLPLAATLAVESDGEAVRFIADLLD